MDKISIVIPVYNSGEGLLKLYLNLVMELKKLDMLYEIILVDDNSRDSSYKTMKKIKAEDENVKIIKLKENYGQQNALLCGFRHSTGNYIVTMDDDMQNPPSEIKNMLDKFKEGYQVVYGIAKNRNYSKFRNFGSFITNILFNVICHKPKNIKVSSFRIITSNILKKVVLEKSSFVYISAIILKETKNIGNVMVTHNSREYGNSNYKPIKLVRLFVKIFIYYSGYFEKIKSKKPQYEIEELHL